MNKKSISIIMILVILSSYVLTACKNSTSSATTESTTASKNTEYEKQSRYYLGDYIELPVRNQGDFGTCWAFAVLNSLETNLALQGETYDFSEMHMAVLMTGDADMGGGDTEFSIQYLFGNHGPVLEETVPYKLYSQEEAEQMHELPAVVKTNQLTVFSNKEVVDDWEDKKNIIKSVKQYIPYQGSIAVNIDASQITENDNTQMAMYTNENTIWDSESSHMVTLVGWDDYYPANNFPQEDKPTHDGAFIALNSWGEEWGENGLFYISYDDLSVYTEMIAVGITDQQLKTVTGKFKDKYLYEALKKEKYYIIDSYNDDTMEIDFYENTIAYITTLNLLDYPVTDLTGIDTLYSLEFIYADRSKIKDESALYNLKNFDWDFWQM